MGDSIILNNHCHSEFRITNGLLSTAVKSEVERGPPFLVHFKVKRSSDSSEKELKQLTYILKILKGNVLF